MTNVTGGPSLEELAPGVPELIANWCGWSETYDDGDETPGGGSQTDVLVGYAEDFELFHTPDDLTYATFEVNDHTETWPVESKRFEQYLRRRYYEDRGKAPKANALNDAVETIAARAVFGGPEERVFLRVASYGEAIYVDLANDLWEAVEVTTEGWRVVSDPPVKFIRKNNSAPLPQPVAGGSVESLRPFVNVRSDEEFRLITFWLAGALNPDGPYPLLEINGERGSAKTTAMRVLVALTDPAVEEPRALPRDERDLAIAANGNWALADKKRHS